MPRPNSLPESAGGRDLDNRATFMRLFTRCAALPEVARLYGLTAEEMGLALHYARLSKILSAASERAFTIAPPPAYSPPSGKAWCEQCDRLVALVEAASCTSQWCKAREAKAA